MKLEDFDEAPPPSAAHVETSAQSASFTARNSQPRRNGPSLPWDRVKESLELLKALQDVRGELLHRQLVMKDS